MWSLSAVLMPTVCVDKRDGQYVPTKDTSLRPTDRLQSAAGPPEESLPRHMGHEVTARGVLSKQDPLPGMTLRRANNNDT